jgi:hypothetical protein
MPESTSLGRLLVLAGVAVWLGSPPSPAEAQVEKSRPGARAAAKPPAEDKGVLRAPVARGSILDTVGVWKPLLSATPTRLARPCVF